jgi:hypothetical protein
MSMTRIKKRAIGGTHALLTDDQELRLERRARELSGHLYTPRLRNGRRIGIILDNASYHQVRGRGLGKRGTVTDLNTDEQYEIAGAACSLHGCVCDAIAARVSGRKV